MALAKALLLLLASSALVAICLSENKRLVVGDRQPGDGFELEERVAEEFSWIGKKVIVEKWFNATRGHVITQVVATNEVTDGTGAEVAVTGGGPGQNAVRLRFKSERLHGVYYKVVLYGKSSYEAVYTSGR